MQFDDHAIYYICHERNDGSRALIQAERYGTPLGTALRVLGFLAGAAMGGNPRIRRNARWLWPSQAIA